MSILEAKEVWRRRSTRRVRGRGPLSIDECLNTRKALLFLAARAPSPAELADQLGLTVDALYKARSPRRPPTVRLAALVARAAKVNLEDVLSGAWPGDACPMCGRRG